MNQRARMIRRQRSVPPPPGARSLKIVVTGPFSSGKTTLIQTISEIAVVGTERKVSGPEAGAKRSTTVAMDFGRISLPEGLSLSLFGTPGQRRFETMWQILSEGMLGFILLVDGSRVDTFADAAHIRRSFEEYADVPYVVGVTHVDEVGGGFDAVCERVRSDLELPPEVGVVAIDSRVRDDIKVLILAVLAGVLERLERAEGARN